jgi:hypothetical protein
MADARRQKHTFCIQTNLIDVAGRLTTAQIAAMATAGHEIASHSIDHSSMSGLTASQVATQYDSTKATLEGIVGAGNVTTFTYPQGMSGRTNTTDSLAYLRWERLLSTGLISGGGVGTSSPWVVDRYFVGDLYLIGRINWTSTTHNQILALIRLAAVRPVIVVIYGHDLDGTAAPTTAQATEGFPAGTLLADPGFEDSTLASWSITNAGGNTAESLADAPATGYPGTRSLHCKVVSSGNVQAAQLVPVRTATAYKLTAQHRVDVSGGGTVTMRIREFDTAGSQLASNSTAALTSTTWARATMTVTTNAATAYALVEFVTNGICESWFDHVHFAPSATGAVG